MLVISFVAFCLCLCFQLKYFLETRKQRELYYHFFKKKQPYDVGLTEVNTEVYTQLVQVGEEGSDLNQLIEEINHSQYMTIFTSSKKVQIWPNNMVKTLA